jgi:competence protein ComEC
LDGLVVSHQDSDHAGGVPAVIAELPASWMAAGLPDDHPLWALVPRKMRCLAGARWTWDGVGFEFLSPPEGHYSADTRTNRMSCVLRIASANGRRALLTADAEVPEEDALLADRRLTKVDVLQVPHQGSKSSSSPGFVAATAPKVAWIPVGYRNQYGHPHPDVLRRYEAAGSQILRSDRDGAIHVELGEALKVDARRQERRRYWDGR